MSFLWNIYKDVLHVDPMHQVSSGMQAQQQQQQHQQHFAMLHAIS